ncbi:uncharacterized protein MAM_02876 [Metarhizium album ARSEF 1941]|uniref:YAG7-like dimerisation domain-containing protein n=1 Tax=Metarhizium album (strain ARSEF 1941) TaxID=1081103 RepID=A0A0B2WYR2_METAS|nr:uncharacterized protein MAM_02876 [Metarhizium album ARSEF 1941]KHN99178.1 hypothetical protein MAM_02876 [Metarhizium album ARSEF 1941]
MPAPATQSAPKGSKKKTTGAVRRAESPAPSFGSGAAADSQDEVFESPYIKELHKNIRNLNKKITNASKTDSLLSQSQYAGKTLDELVHSKVINPDQRAQILKKPDLQAQVARAEEQLAQYQKVHEQYRSRAANEKAEWEKSLEKAKADAVSEAEASFQKSVKSNLLVLSQFLRLAAYRREEAADADSDESQAIEGVLLAVYAGDDSAVASMLKLLDGTEDKIFSVPGEQLQTTYSVVKALAQEYKAPVYNEGPTEGEATAEVVTDDPTVARVAATEIASTDIPASPEEKKMEASNGYADASISADSADAVAESHWDTEAGLSASQEWIDVKIPRDPSETDTGLTATPAASANTQSWADEQPEPAKLVSNGKISKPDICLTAMMDSIRSNVTRVARSAKEMAIGVVGVATVVNIAGVPVTVVKAVGVVEDVVGCSLDRVETKSPRVHSWDA